MSFRDKLDYIYSDIMKRYELNESLSHALDLVDDLQNAIDDLTPKK